MASALQTLRTMTGAWLQPLSAPWGIKRRRAIADAAMVSHYAALQKPILLCLTCEAKMPRKWTERYGYRVLHDMHTEGECTYCRTYLSCNLYHHVEGDYCQEWVRHDQIRDAARQQQLLVRDRRRVF